MPLRAYRPANPPCRLCGDGFDVSQAASDPALTICPRCGQPVKPVVATPVSTPPETTQRQQQQFPMLTTGSDDNTPMNKPPSSAG